MDNRKTYVRPAVESEEMLEQTSLACNMIMGPEGEPGFPTCGPALQGAACIAPLFKGYNWENTECTDPFPIQGSCAVQYS